MKWEKLRLSQVAEYITDGDHQPAPKAKSGISFIKIKDIENNSISFDSAIYVPDDYYNRLPSNRKPQQGDVLYTVVGSYGIPVYVQTDKKFCFERNIALIHPNNRVYPLFLYYSLLNPLVKKIVDSIANGSAQKLIPLSKLERIELNIPSLLIQNKITNVLSSFDRLISINQKQIKLLEEAAQRLYKEWFVDLRFPGHETTPIIDGVPEGWIVCSIDDLGEYINGYAFKPSDWEESGKPIIKIKELNEGVTKNTPRNSGIDVPEKYYISAGDIVFSWSATLTAMIWDGEDGLLNQHLFKVIPKDSISREFVLQSILNALNEFKNLTTGATMKHIQRGKLKEVFLLFPKLTIMQKYQRVSEPIRNQILKLRNSNFDLQEARDRLLPKLMNGEIEV